LNYEELRASSTKMKLLFGESVTRLVKFQRQEIRIVAALLMTRFTSTVVKAKVKSFSTIYTVFASSNR